MKITPRPDQWQFIGDVYQAWNQGAQNVLGRADTGFGKCLARGTPVILADGRTVPVESVQPGDELLGPDGKPRRVLTTCRGVEPLYRVTPKSGQPYTVNESHILSLRVTAGSKSKKHPAGAVRNLSIREYLAETPAFRHCAKGWRVAIDWPETGKPLPVDPYFLGVWLGDGTRRTTAITTGDSVIVDYCRRYFESWGLTARFKRNSARSISVSGIDVPGRNPLYAALRALGVAKEKHVPLGYRTAPRADRLALLAGMLDADGHLIKKGGFSLSLKDERLFDDILFVARSLGFSATKRTIEKTCANNGVRGKYFSCSINGALDEIPTKLARKKSPPRRQKKNVLLTGITVDPVGPGEYFGFEIDGDRLFLLGDFTVTHNTVCIGQITEQNEGGSCLIAHRQELVGQISLMLARYGVRHNIIAAENTRRAIAQTHVAELGQCFYTPSAQCAVAGVDTLVRRQIDESWAKRVTLAIPDEAHHVLRDNKWGAAMALFPNARAFMPTATPMRADGKGLGRHADGLVDTMVHGPPMRWLIEQGFLTDYRIVCVESDLSMVGQEVAASGDWSPAKLKDSAERSQIVGDLVANYLRFARGMLNIAFTTDTETAARTTAAFQAAGVKAACLTGKTQDALRRDTLRRFSRREIEVIVAVDIISEGFDLPAIECVQFGRPTASYGLYAQQFGRALRPMPGKQKALILDHVGNVLRHLPPDRPRVWSLDRRDAKKKKAGDEIPMRVCVECFEPYEAIYPKCPNCGHKPEPAARSSPQMVDGDLAEMSPEVLDALRGQIEYADRSNDDERARLIATGLHHVGVMAGVNRHAEAVETRQKLRAAMERWGGRWHAVGESDAVIQRRFFHTFGIDVATAQTLKRAESQALLDRILGVL